MSRPIDFLRAQWRDSDLTGAASLGVRLAAFAAAVLLVTRILL